MRPSMKTIARVLAVLGVLGALAMSAGADWFSAAPQGTSSGNHLGWYK